MKIKKVDDKPMVIRTKKKAKLHTHEPKKASIKASNIYTVDRSPKIKGSKIATTENKKFRRSTIHQVDKAKKGMFRQYRAALKESKQSIKTKNSSIKMKAEGEQQDSFAKLVKDLFVNKMAIPIKKIMVAVGGFLLVLVLLIAVTVLPVVAVIAILYNSPFAFFLPPLESVDTVTTVTSAYY